MHTEPYNIPYLGSMQSCQHCDSAIQHHDMHVIHIYIRILLSYIYTQAYIHNNRHMCIYIYICVSIYLCMYMYMCLCMCIC